MKRLLPALAGLMLLTTLGTASPVALVVSGLVVLGTGFGLFSSPNSNAALSAVDRRHYGIAAATLGTMRVVGQALSMSLVALILGHHMGRQGLGPESVPQLVKSTRVALGLFAGLCAVGALASLARGRAASKTMPLAKMSSERWALSRPCRQGRPPHYPRRWQEPHARTSPASSDRCP